MGEESVDDDEEEEESEAWSLRPMLRGTARGRSTMM